MSEKDPGLLDELKKWLEFDDKGESELGDGGSSSPEIQKLQDELAMETDPKKREILKKKIREIDERDEPAENPTHITGIY